VIPKRTKEDTKKLEPIFAVNRAGNARQREQENQKELQGNARCKKQSIGLRTNTSCFTDMSGPLPNELLNNYNNKRIGIFFETMIDKTRAKARAKSSIPVFTCSTQRSKSIERLTEKRNQPVEDKPSLKQFKRLTKVVGKLKHLLGATDSSRNSSTLKKRTTRN
jgi:hypothetical protein